MDFQLLEPRQLKREGEDTYVAAKCSVCKKCWLNIRTKKCMAGGPFTGYIKEEPK